MESYISSGEEMLVEGFFVCVSVDFVAAIFLCCFLWGSRILVKPFVNWKKGLERLPRVHTGAHCDRPAALALHV